MALLGTNEHNLLIIKTEAPYLVTAKQKMSIDDRSNPYANQFDPLGESCKPSE